MFFCVSVNSLVTRYLGNYISCLLKPYLDVCIHQIDDFVKSSKVFPIMNTFVIIIVVCDGCFYGLFEKRIYDLCNHTHESYNEKRRGGCIIQKYTKLFTFFRWVWKRVNFIFTLFSSSSCVSYINSVSVKEKTWLVLRSCLKFCVS